MITLMLVKEKKTSSLTGLSRRMKCLKKIPLHQVFPSIITISLLPLYYFFPAFCFLQYPQSLPFSIANEVTPANENACNIATENNHHYRYVWSHNWSALVYTMIRSSVPLALALPTL